MRALVFLAALSSCTTYELSPSTEAKIRANCAADTSAWYDLDGGLTRAKLKLSVTVDESILEEDGKSPDAGPGKPPCGVP